MKLIQRVAAASAVAVIATGTLSACGAGDSTADQAGATDLTLNLGSKIEPSSFTPAAAATGPYAVFYLPIYDPLFVFEDDGTPVGKLVSEHAWSDDNLTLTLTLHEGIEFSDGEPFDAAAVKANLEYYRENPGPAGPVLGGVDSIETPAESTVVLTLGEPNPGLLTHLAGPAGYMGSPVGLASGELTTNPIGTGPYTLDLDETVTGSQYVYERKDDYWDGEQPYAELRYFVMADETARVNALKSGQLDYAPLDNPANGVDAQAAGFTLQENYATFEGILFYDRDGSLSPELADKRVREALRIAIDTDTLRESVKFGYGEPTGQVFPEWSDAYIPELDDAYEYDPERAKQLLAEAGYADGFSIPFPETNTLAPELYLAIKEYWKEIGVTAQTHQWGQGEAVPSQQKGEFPLSYFTVIFQDSWAMTNFVATPQAPYNPFETETSELNELLNDMQYGATPEERKEAGQAVNRYLVDEVWFGPTFRPTQFLMTNDAVELNPIQGYSLPPYFAFTPAQ